jgi:hypothetical protein
MTIHILKYENIGSWFCGKTEANDTFVTPQQLKEIEHSIDLNSVCTSCVRMAAVWAEAAVKVETSLKDHAKPEEKPKPYSILQSDTGRWQIIRRNTLDNYWQVAVKDLSSRSNAVLMLDALNKRDADNASAASVQ